MTKYIEFKIEKDGRDAYWNTTRMMVPIDSIVALKEEERTSDGRRMTEVTVYEGKDYRCYALSETYDEFKERLEKAKNSEYPEQPRNFSGVTWKDLQEHVEGESVKVANEKRGNEAKKNVSPSKRMCTNKPTEYNSDLLNPNNHMGLTSQLSPNNHTTGLTSPISPMNPFNDGGL